MTAVVVATSKESPAMKKRIGKIVYWVACFILTSGLATYAAESGRSEVVSYSDLNLAHEDGARTLLTRLDHAATHVCGGRPGIADLRAWASYEVCRKAAMDRAVATLSAPLVASLYGAPQPSTRIAAR
jgi:UrcA family protein